MMSPGSVAIRPLRSRAGRDPGVRPMSKPYRIARRQLEPSGPQDGAGAPTPGPAQGFRQPYAYFTGAQVARGVGQRPAKEAAAGRGVLWGSGGKLVSSRAAIRK